jgi:hypothetical protein
MTTRAAACVREIVAERSSWTGSAADILQAGAGHSSTDWPKNPRALVGRLRRTQTFLRGLGIEIAFNRCNSAKYRQHRQHRPRTLPPCHDNVHRNQPVRSVTNLSRSIVCAPDADDADGADAKAVSL